METTTKKLDVKTEGNVITKILFKFRINRNWIRRFKEAGIEVGFRSRKEDQELIKKHTAEAEKQGLDALRYNRTDKTGTKRPDSGVSLFAQGKQDPEPISVTGLHEDIKKLGCILTNVHIFVKERDNMGFLVFVYEPTENNTVEEVKLDDKQKMILKLYSEKTFEHLHSFLNPDGSITINVAHITEEEPRKRMRISWKEVKGEKNISVRKESL